MARQLLGEKKVNQLRKKLSLPIVQALVRGGTDHRIDLCLINGDVIHYWPDGTMEKSTIGWNHPINELKHRSWIGRVLVFRKYGWRRLLFIIQK